MSILDNVSPLSAIRPALQAAEASVQHGAAWLIGAANMAETSLTSLEADSPLVSDAIGVVTTWAAARGIGTDDVKKLGADILALAQTVESNMGKDALASDASSISASTGTPS